ncbi:(1-_4)-alpha-D-glucan branching enzyme [Marinitoga hydrogenitolerans DSM 16785]|uniref:(1->4)-alpha-D-glucan branching enzyme n=1 Tax=Marinitoga hydrogenitolerans (strain DSM 16785 / JCM 12826 / AT1271) TaxID=1122195 RepID=A0A1M4T2N6_MARH1|nr:1,4-alpha-glucan branching protein domain-containing protein [Marinitoga hydrogenitolerans]SHE38557.1 (1->4)-alpha-D-glucan branching enzyme [Marinitoga hydrogenitolerans DSM 16785]
MNRGKIMFVLHSHLPYVRHPDYEEFMEERWLFEAITETYVPLIRMFKKLERKEIDFKLVMSFSPTLMEMLNSIDLQEKYIRYLKKIIELSEKEYERTKDEELIKHKMADYYRNNFKEILEIFEKDYNKNILNAFKEYKEKGYLELITTAATHAVLPLYSEYPEIIRMQIKYGLETFKKVFGDYPEGFWLPEMGYFEGLDSYLKEFDIKYFFVEKQGLIYGNPYPIYNTFNPAITNSNVFVFSRDKENNIEIFDTESGYLNDPRYREFYRDIGFDRDYEYIKDYIDKSGVRCNTGIKYYKITGKDKELFDKLLYDIDEAYAAVKEDAANFVQKKLNQLRDLKKEYPELSPIMVYTFDTEFFGHWWYEGILFLEKVIEKVYNTDELILKKAEDIIKETKEVQVLTPSKSSWGINGFFEEWVNGNNDWIYPAIYEMIEILRKKFKNDWQGEEKKIISLMIRELMLAQSSDWAFIISSGTTVEYAVNRIKTHVKRFFELNAMLESGKIEKNKLKYYMWVDKIFENIDYSDIM